MNNFLSIAQYAQKHDLDRTWVWRLIQRGRIRATKVGSTWVIPADEPKPEDGRVKSGNYRNWRKSNQKEN